MEGVKGDSSHRECPAYKDSSFSRNCLHLKVVSGSQRLPLSLVLPKLGPWETPRETKTSSWESQHEEPLAAKCLRQHSKYYTTATEGPQRWACSGPPATAWVILFFSQFFLEFYKISKDTSKNFLQYFLF